MSEPADDWLLTWLRGLNSPDPHPRGRDLTTAAIALVTPVIMTDSRQARPRLA